MFESLLLGGDGNDTLIGIWDDELQGGSGQDTFVLAQPSAKIADFENGEVIDPSQLDANSTLAGNQAFQWDNGSNSGQAGVLKLVKAGGGIYYLQATFDNSAFLDLDLQVQVVAGSVLTQGDVLI